MKKLKGIFKFLLALGGCLFVMAAFFARQLGIDNNDRWGLGRSVLLAVGLGLWAWLAWLLTPSQRRHLAAKIAASPLLASIRLKNEHLAELWSHSRINRCLKTIVRFFAGLPGIRWLLESDLRQTWFWAVLGLAFTLLVYTWLATTGKWYPLTPTSSYYDLQAQGFLHGQLSLLKTPPPELLALENPYDVNARRNLAYVWDTSLYQGRYYLYWGPIPALLGAGFRAITGNALGDETLSFIFLCLLAVTQAFWLVELRRLFFPRSAPIWLAVFICAVGLSNPIPYDIARMKIYEASIISGQFFLLSGLFLLVKGMQDGRFWTGRWLGAGLLLGMALSARINLVSVLPWVALLVIGRAWVVSGYHWRSLIKPLLAGGFAFGIVMLAIMAYNYARFGSPFELGNRYQLTMADNNHSYSAQISPAFMIPNLYAYLFRLPVGMKHFPFIYANWVTDTEWPFFIRIPNGYFYTDPVSGLLVTTPFIWLLGVVLVNLLGRLIKKAPRKFGSIFGENWVLWLLGGCGVFTFGFLLLFYYPTMRYLTDASPLLLIMATVGAWQWTGEGRARGFKTFLVLLLVLISVLIGVLLGINGLHDYFEHNNPDLFFKLVGFFKF
jgi:hypothetical protein